MNHEEDERSLQFASLTYFASRLAEDVYVITLPARVFCNMIRDVSKNQNDNSSQENISVPLFKSFATISATEVIIRPSKRTLLVPSFQAAITIAAIIILINGLAELPLWISMILLLTIVIFGPTAVLGTVYGIVGSNFVMEKNKGTSRLQQKYLGLGIGKTMEQSAILFESIGQFVDEYPLVAGYSKKKFTKLLKSSEDELLNHCNKNAVSLVRLHIVH